MAQAAGEADTPLSAFREHVVAAAVLCGDACRYELVVFERLERGREAVVPAEVVQSEQWCLQARSPSGSSDGPDVARGSELATEVCCG
jgi:hypothetical protein